MFLFLILGRLPLSQKTETDITDSLASPVPSDTQNPVSSSNFSPEASPSSDPFESFNMFSNLHSSMAPPKPERTLSDSRGPQLLGYPGDPLKNEKHHPKNGIQVNSPTSEKSQIPSLPLPDYEALFPRKRHGVMTDTRWEHIIAEVNQRKMAFEESQKEMSVDGPEEPSFTKEMEPKQPIIPPKPSNLATSSWQHEPISEQGHKQLYSVYSEGSKTDLERNTESSVPSQQDTQINVKKTLNQIPDPTPGQFLQPKKEKPTPTARNIKKPTSPADQSLDIDTTGLPQAKPRQGTPSKEPVNQVQPKQDMQAFTSSQSSQVERKKEGSTTTKSLWESFKEGKPIPVNETNKTVKMPKVQPFDVTSAPETKQTEFDPFPIDKLICKDPWALPLQTMDEVDLFTQKKGKVPEDQRLSSDDFDDVFGSVASKNEKDPFFIPKDKANSFFESVASKNETDSNKSNNSSPLNQKVYSQRKKTAPQPLGKPEIWKDNVDRPALQEADYFPVNSFAELEGDEATTASSKAHLDLFAPVSSAVPELQSGGKGTLCGWVSPSEVQSGTSQSSGGGGVLTSRR